MLSNSTSIIPPFPSAAATSVTAPISAALSARSVIEGFNLAAASNGFGTGFETSLHGDANILSLLVDRPPTAATKANPLLSAYKFIPTPSAGATSRPSPTGLGARLLAEPSSDEGGGEGGDGGARAAPTVEPIRPISSLLVDRRSASRRPTSPASPAVPAADSKLPPASAPHAPPGESAADAAARYALRSHYPSFARLFPCLSLECHSSTH